MGQCQSQSSGEFAPGNGVHDMRSFDIKTGNSSTTTPRKRGGRLDRLLILIPGVKSSSKAETGFPFSPSDKSGATQPLTPGSFMESPSSPSRRKLEALAEGEEDEGFPSLMSGSSPRYSDAIMEAGVMDTIITEEESLGAPSDEEDFHEEQQELQYQEQEMQEDEKSYQSLQSFPDDESLKLSKKKSVANPISSSSTQRSIPTTGNNSPPCKLTRVKLQHKRITTPESINFHKPSLVAPPKGSAPGPLSSTSAKTSVNPHTIADFNKLKIQVKLALRAESHTRRKAKLEDRLGDVKGYRNLWSEYEEIEQQVIEQQVKESSLSDTEGPASDPVKKHMRSSSSLNLKRPKTWYFDFQQLDLTKNADQNNKSKVSMSLLSEASMEAQCRLYKEKRRERRQKSKSKSKNKKEPRIIFSDDRSVSSFRSSASVQTFNGQKAENDYGPPTGLASIEVPYYSSGEDTPKAKSQSRRGRTDSDDDFSLLSAYTANDDYTACSEDEGGNDYGVQRRRPRKNYTDDCSISTFGDRSMDSYGGSRSHRGGGEAAFDINNDFAPRIRQAPVTIDVKNTSINVVKKKSSKDTKKKTTEEVKKTPLATTPIDKYGFDPAAPLFSQLDLDLTLPSVEIDDASTGKLRWREFSKAEQSRVDGDTPTRCLEDDFLIAEPVAKPTLESVSAKEAESSESVTTKEPESKEVDLTLAPEPQVEETAASVPISQEPVQKEEACDSNPEAEPKIRESAANVSISREPVIFEEKKEPEGSSSAEKTSVERKQTHDSLLPKDLPTEQEKIKTPLPTVSSEEDRLSEPLESTKDAESEAEDEKPVVPEAIEAEDQEVSASVPVVSKVTEDDNQEVATVVAVDGDSVNAKVMEEARTQPESHESEGKVGTKGFSLYDPRLADLSPEQFLLLASAEKYFPEDNEDEEQSEHEAIDEPQPRKSASKFDIANAREREKIRRQSAYNPVIAGMSTDDFLRISYTMGNFVPSDEESPERPPLRLEGGDMPPKKLNFASDDEEMTDSLTQNDQAPSSESSKADTSDISDCDYVDCSDELAVDVTDNIPPTSGIRS